MNPIHFISGPTANHSEELAIQAIMDPLKNEPGNDRWVILSNIMLSLDHNFKSDEIDLLILGPTGVWVIEVKHWTDRWIKDHSAEVDQAVNLISMKARKVASTVRKYVPEVPFVTASILLTTNPGQIKDHVRTKRGDVTLYGRDDWKSIIGFGNDHKLTTTQIDVLATKLEPRAPVAIDGALRRLSGYINLQLQTKQTERFHRVYKGQHYSKRFRVILHLYDLTSSVHANPGTVATREYDALSLLQKFVWCPVILDTPQPVPGYPGEMSFFTIVDPLAPSIKQRMSDSEWETDRRLQFSRSAIGALMEVHSNLLDGQPLVHRNLSETTILVKHDDSVILTGFELTKIATEISIGESFGPDDLFPGQNPDTVAPEVKEQGLSVASTRSDVFAICTSLKFVFQGRDDDLSREAIAILELGTAEAPDQRASLKQLDELLGQLLGDTPPEPEPKVPSPEFWTEGLDIRWHGRNYQIVQRLGSGGIGSTFQVVDRDVITEEEFGDYVAKVAHKENPGLDIKKAYRLARPHLPGHTSLSTIFDVGTDAEGEHFSALMSWVPGTPLDDFAGALELLLFTEEGEEEVPIEEFVINWLILMCEALGVLHRNALIHGDVSPRNMIVTERDHDLTLTDYDFVTKIGAERTGFGTPSYSSYSPDEKPLASESDDFYALAASFFRVLFNKNPFEYDGGLDKSRGLNWTNIEKDNYPIVAKFMDKATNPDPGERFSSAEFAIASLKVMAPPTGDPPTGDPPTGDPPTGDPPTVPVFSPKEVTWLKDLLSVYPGSIWGNDETVGIDTEFASSTYVETQLESHLFDEINNKIVQLVILCGNAGDGKTALLQYLIQKFGFEALASSERVLDKKLDSGIRMRVNLDGAASWKDMSADENMDQFMEPFQQGAPTGDEHIVHLLAINDGKLMEWIESYRERFFGDTFLTQELENMLTGDEKVQDSFIRFISLNERSLVGSINDDPPNGDGIDIRFMDSLVDSLYGGDKAGEIWKPCQTCSAKSSCQAYSAAQVFGPQNLLHAGEPHTVRRARTRLFDALQAVHLRGETHITMRELRASLSYILFGTSYCTDYHQDLENLEPYWDRAFDSESFNRQGELLSDLSLFDPGFEAHPRIDRQIVSSKGNNFGPFIPRYPELSISSARRRGYFEWNDDQISHVAGDTEALGLARCKHLKTFRSLGAFASIGDDDQIVKELCLGIARLEDLPSWALNRDGVVPLRITPRTHSDTHFWVEKNISNFRLEPEFQAGSAGLERLHRRLILIYSYEHSMEEERLLMGYELFNLLLELADGFQLGDTSTDDTFAQLSIFKQRLVREDDGLLMAWNPMNDENIYSLYQENSGSDKKLMVIGTLDDGGKS